MNSATLELGPDRWRRVEDLFAAATQLPAEDQCQYVITHCSDDKALCDYIIGLLDTDPNLDATIERTVVDTLSQLHRSADDESINGQTIGPYRVKRLLGSGGMGVVYLAERADEQFDQQVAIKLGRHRLVDPATEIRLRNERQILADLDHQNIARLFDGGMTGDGVPYLVMEHIDGIRIDTFCDLHRLTIKQRLQMFRKICSAVHHAHQNLVIHRDIKASNILVTDNASPKLLDFGIAKLIEPTDSLQDGITREGAVIMTPANAAPEQVLGKPITTATDVYALGLLLFNLLSGLRAYDTENLGTVDFVKIVCEREVSPPSVRLSQNLKNTNPANKEECEAIALDRSTTPERLQRLLQGDLDTIVTNALHKDPARRYQSANALANDIDLYLRSMPIVARADSWRYRAGKFVRRHYAAVTASAVVVAVLVGFTVLLAAQNRTVIKERDTAREVSQFLENIFMAPDPSMARGASITAEELLASGAERIRNDLTERPAIQSALMGTIGRVYFNLGEYEPSVEMLEGALALRLQSYKADHADVAAVQNDLAEALLRVPDYDRAESLLTTAIATNREQHGANAPSVAKNLFNLAELHLKTSEPGDAAEYAEQSIVIYEQFDHGFSIELAEAKNLLARILQVTGDLDRTEALLIEAINIVVENEGNDHPLMAYYLQNLGVLQRSKGNLDAAAATLEQAADSARRILGEQHHLLAATLVSQGTLLHATGQLDEAEGILREALQMHIDTRGPDHPMVGYDLTLLGMLLHDRNKLVAAEEALVDALSVYDIALDPNHQYTASALTELGAVLNSSGRPVEALPVLERALTIRESDYPPEHELVVATHTEYADTLARLGRNEEALLILERSVRLLADKPGRRQQRAERALANLKSNSD